MITVLAGGVGAARFLRGLVQIVDPADISVVVNTADDFVLHGLSISPDIDTIRYTLSDDLGTQGWGRSDETWTAMGELHNLSVQAPDSSRASDWFSLGDRDIATHLYRTQRLSEGADLTTVTTELSAGAGLQCALLPMSNDRVSTMLTLDDGEVIDFQEYFVHLQHSVPVNKVEFDGAATAKASISALDAIANADGVIIAPSNPVLSIGPMLAMPEMASLLKSRRSKTVAISPLIDGKAVKGPADHLMTELGYDANVIGIAGFFQQFARHLVMDVADEARLSEVSVLGMEASLTHTLMSDAEKSRLLAKHVMTVLDW